MKKFHKNVNDNSIFLKNKKGFIMVEATIAVIVISLVMVAIAAMFVQSQKANKNSAEYVFATNLAQTQLELLKVQPVSFWANISLPSAINWQDNVRQAGNGGVPNVIITDKNIDYTVTTTAQVCTENANLVQVIVNVSWVSQGGARNVNMTAFYRKI